MPGTQSRRAAAGEREGVPHLGRAFLFLAWESREWVQSMALQSVCSGLQLQLLPPLSCAIWDTSLTSEPVSSSVKWVTLLGTARTRTAHTPPCSPWGPACVPSKMAPL